MKAVLSIAILGLVLIAGFCAADTVEQVDWSGGDGLAGPVSAWSDRFDSSSSISWMAIPGRLALSSTPLVPPVEHLINEAYAGAFGIAAVDIDKDGDIDLLGVSEFSGVVSLWLNQGGTPVTWVEQVMDNTLSRPQAVHPADVDGDGNIDVVGNFLEPLNEVVWWRNDGGDPITWSRSTVDTGWTTAYEIYADDLDGDDDPDIMSTSWDLRDVAWWRNDGGNPVAWTKQTVAASFNGAHSVRCGDLDGDGDKDLVAVAALRNQVAWWRNDGGDPITWVKTVIRNDFIGGRSVRVADIDGDGDMDIAGTSWTSHLCWWRNDGGDPVVWTEQVVEATFNGGHSVEVADVNGDGLPDLLGAAVVDNDVYWYENGGEDSIVWTPHLVDGGVSGAVNVRAADVDGDGAHDIFASAYTSGKFLWWEATEFAGSGDLIGSILDTDGGVVPMNIDWTAETPAGTGLSFQVRSSSDPGSMGAWSMAITSPGTLTGPVERYFQYKIAMTTIDPDYSPLVGDITFTDAETGVVGSATIPSSRRMIASPNPFNPEVVISFHLGREEQAEIAIFNAAGREIARIADGSYPEGSHQISWSGVSSEGVGQPSGVYFARLKTPGREETAKLVLVR